MSPAMPISSGKDRSRLEKNVYPQFYALEKDNWWFAGMRDICQSQISQFEPSWKEGLLLDIGCGTGLWQKELQRFGNTIGLDLSNEALSFCQSRNLTKLIRASAIKLPIVADTFSLVTAMGVIEHLDDDNQALAEIYRVLVPGGYALILTSAYSLLWSYHDALVHHKRRYLATELKKQLADSGFRICTLSYVNFILFPIIAPIRIVQRLRHYTPSDDVNLTDLFNVKEPLNSLLLGILKMEAFLLKFMRLPFGVGIVALVQKPAQ